MAELADRELDAWVAENVMSFVRHKSGVLLPNDDRLKLWFDHAMKDEADRGELWLRVPKYSSDVSLAMEVLTAMRGKVAIADSLAIWVKPNSFIVQIWADDEVEELANELADTLPKAICLAALAAIGVKDEITS